MARPINVLFIITQSEMGGAQRFLVELTAALDPARFRASVAAGPRGNWELLTVLAEHGIPAHRLPNLTRGALPWRWLRAARDIRALADRVQPDVVMLLSSAAGFVGSWALRESGIPVIYRIGGWSFLDPRPSWQRLLLAAVERWSARWKNVIIVNSTEGKVEADRHGIRPRRGVIVIHNGVDIADDEFLPRAEARAEIERRAGRALDPPDKLIGTVANFYPPKGHAILIEAFARIKRQRDNVALALVGDGFLRPAVERLARDRGIADRVLFPRQLENARRYLRAFDIFVLPSLKEGSPWTILEAAAAGIPIIATRVGAIPEILKHEQTGLLVPPGDPVALSDAIERLLGDDALRQRLGAAGQTAVRERFSQRAMVVQFERLIASLVPS